MQRFLVGLRRVVLGTALIIGGPQCFAALPSGTVWEVRPTVGSNTNGGGFVTGSSGTDWSQQNAAQYALTNGVTNGTTTVATVSASADMVGNIAFISGGTGGITAGWYQIVSQVTGVSLTVDRSTGLSAGTGVTINIGGALATPSAANSSATAANVIWIKATGSYTTSTTMTINLDSGAAPGTPYSFIGYTSTRGDNGQATWTTATNSIDLIDFSAAVNVFFENIIFTSTAGTPGLGWNDLVGGNSKQIVLMNSLMSGFSTAIFGNFAGAGDAFTGLSVLDSRITACTGVGLENSGTTAIFGSRLDHNGSDGALWSAGVLSIIPSWVVQNSILDSNGGNGLNTTGLPGGNYSLLFINNSDFSTNTGAGVRLQNATAEPQGVISNSIFDANGTYGIDGEAGTITLPYLFYSNAFYNNTTAPTRNVGAGIGTITLSASPYVSVGTNFALNNTTGGGALLKTAGFPSSIPNGGSGAPAVGALQPSGAGGGQKGFPVVQ
jgi:hypothetical protein